MPTPSRAAFIIVNMARMPLCGSPTSQPSRIVEIHDAGRRGLDAHLVLDAAAGDAVARARRCRPRLGRNFGTRNRLMPRVPAGASGRRASTRWTMFSREVVLAGAR